MILMDVVLGLAVVAMAVMAGMAAGTLIALARHRRAGIDPDRTRAADLGAELAALDELEPLRAGSLRAERLRAAPLGADLLGVESRGSGSPAAGPSCADPSKDFA